MEESKLKYKIALSMIRGVGLLTYKKMISVFGDGKVVSLNTTKDLLITNELLCH